MRVPRFVVVAAVSLVVALFAVAAMGVGGSLQTATSFTVSCGTSATTITGTGIDGYNSLYCQNMSSTSVFLGGSGVTTSNAPCISTTSGTCAKPDFSWDVSRSAAPSCIVASGTVTLKCIAGK
jgi:hypothetical protein